MVTADWLKVLALTSNSRGHYTALVVAKCIVLCVSCTVSIDLYENKFGCISLLSYICRRTRTIPLRCKAPVDFDFQLSMVQPHPAYTVHPMSGIIPAYGQIEITVTFAPIEFNTAIMKLQLTISQFNSTPLVCTFIGTSTPGLAQ